MRAAVSFVSLMLCAATLAAQESSPGARKLPPYYAVKSECIPGRGYVAFAEAPGHAPELPLLALFVYRGEVIGALFEAHERDGWRPWYNEKQGEPVSHDGGPRHYSHTVMFKKGPSVRQCKTAKGPLER